MSAPQPLNPLSFPLRGSRLIEASAGTGKTFTLALLYVRLVLGHGVTEDAAPTRPLLPPEILVVTFTKAATKELRDRIRARLVEAAALFSAPAPDDPAAAASATTSGDPLLALRNSYPCEAWPDCALRLRQAAEWMDEAAIFTIHGWCQRMLQEHAFATRGLFEREMAPEQGELLAELVRDYWRQTFYPLSTAEAACVLEAITSPDELRKKLVGWFSQRDNALSYAGEPLSCPELTPALQAAAEHQRVVRGLENDARQAWRDDRQALETYLRELRPHLNGRVHGSANEGRFEQLLGQIAAWAGDERVAAPGKLATFATGRFTFRAAARVQEAETHAAFDAIAAWKAAAAAPQTPARTDSADDDAAAPTLTARIIAHAVAWLSRELPRRLAQRAEMGFDDLLLDLDAALTPATSPPGGQLAADPAAASAEPANALAALIRQQFPAALIDEFQDTDPVQYRIVDRVYRVAANDPATLLVMIGDPKQAIYSFRGADIHTYLAARRAVDGRIYQLERNFRSTTAMVAACNRLFQYAEGHARGAFRFRTTQEADNPVPFVEVQAQGRDERLQINGETAPSLTLWSLAGTAAPAEVEGSAAAESNAGSTHLGLINQDTYTREMAARTASEVRRWLAQAREKLTGFVNKDGGLRPLQPHDIAILVRTGSQADALYQALSARGIPSVYLSERNSVFEGTEAQDLVHWLRACAEPTDEALVRNALATTSYALPPGELAEIIASEDRWEAAMERFRGYRQLWRNRGVLAMLRTLLHEGGLPARLLAQARGERTLTNLLHLAEWLQQAAERLDGEQALIRHLTEQLDNRDESATVRLESDAERVQIITIHKSKGLEYPLVLLPFACHWRPIDHHTSQVAYRTEDGGRRLWEISGNKVFRAGWQQADDERLSEDMRLLYVAATRAQHGLWLGVGLLKHGNTGSSNMHLGAFGYLLGGGEPVADAHALHCRLHALVGDGPPHNELTLTPAPIADASVLPTEENTSPAPARAPTHGDFDRWWIASYSALRFRASADTPSESTALEETEQDRPAYDPSLPDDAIDEAAMTGAIPAAADADASFPPAPASSTLQTGGQTTNGNAVASLHGLPRGSTYGTFLHGLLEWAAEQQHLEPDGRRIRGYRAAALATAARREVLERRCPLRGLTDWIDTLDAWLPAWLQQPLTLHGLEDAQGNAPQFALADLAPNQLQVEMEFWIESNGVEAEALDALVRTHCLPGRRRAMAEPEQLNGMLKGFIDLVFEHEGRYYVLDWKSNWLGEDDAAYSRDAMAEAVLHHRYDLQYALYLLALHRQLKARLPGYDYDRHIGGAVYAFLRGHQAPGAGLFTERPPRALIEGLDALFAGEAYADEQRDQHSALELSDTRHAADTRHSPAP